MASMRSAMAWMVSATGHRLARYALVRRRHVRGAAVLDAQVDRQLLIARQTQAARAARGTTARQHLVRQGVRRAAVEAAHLVDADEPVATVRLRLVQLAGV